MILKNNRAEFLIIDVGSAWSKGFLVNINRSFETIIKIEDKISLPTSIGQLDLTINLITNKFKLKEIPVILSGKLDGLALLARDNKYFWIEPEEAELSKNRFFGSQTLIFDAGAHLYNEVSKLSDIDRINSFLTEATSHIETENYIANKKIYPHLLPENNLQLQIEEGFSRLVLQKKLKQNTGALILTGGVLSNHPKMTSLILLVLDALDEEILQIYLDKEQFIPSLGVLLSFLKLNTTLRLQPEIINLGAAVQIGAREVILDSGDGGQKITIKEEDIVRLPAKEGVFLKLEFKRGSKKIVASLLGGSTGLFLDSRKKPINTGEVDTAQNLKWRAAVGEEK